MVSGRGSHRPKEQPDPSVGANRQPTGGTQGPRLRLGLCIWCGLPVAGQGGGADHADLQYRRDEPSLCEISSQVAADAHAVVILDGASWHNSHGLVVPSNITLLALPPYSPELNPVERIWHYLRSHWLANSVFRSLADIMDACEMAWNRFATNTGLVRSLCAVAWAPASSAP